jgi:beta-glucosidase
VRFPFGYGLSYTFFEYSDLKLDKDSFGPADEIKVTLTVKNAGSAPGRKLSRFMCVTSKPAWCAPKRN